MLAIFPWRATLAPALVLPSIRPLIILFFCSHSLPLLLSNARFFSISLYIYTYTGKLYLVHHVCVKKFNLYDNNSQDDLLIFCIYFWIFTSFKLLYSRVFFSMVYICFTHHSKIRCATTICFVLGRLYFL